jgi:O-antigen/teichoic acid export membrane protein
MSYDQVRKNIVSNALSNYVRTGLGIVVGLLTFRLLYQALNREEFGFWSLLWSVFGYGILLDFGFGFAAQKRVAELSVKQDWPQLSRVLSTIFCFYAGIAAAIALVVLLISGHMVRWFDVSAANAPEFRRVLIVFFVGIALAFPMGIFPEILRGQQRIRLANNLISGFLVLRLGLIWVALHQHWGFLPIMAIALFCSLAPDCLAALFALQLMPEVKIRPSLFSRGMIGETMKFSVFAYISTATNLVLGKTDQLVLGGALGITAVALYQAGAKVAEVFSQFTRQVQDTLTPAAAHLHASGNLAAIRDLLVQGTRWSVLIATPLYLLCAVYLEGLLQLLTGDREIPRATWLVGHVLLFWYYTTILTHSVSKRIFMMTGHERRLMWLGLGEALANLVISVALVLTQKTVVAVAIGSLIPSLWFGWVHLWPWVAKDVGLGGWQLFRQTVLPSWIASLPMGAVLYGLSWVKLSPGGDPRWETFLEGGLAGVVGAVGLWRLALSTQERAALLRKLPARFRKGGT